MMNKSTRNLLFALIAAAVLIAPLSAEELPGERYIVILKQRAGTAPDVASLGGTIESRQEEQLVVWLPAGAAASLKDDPKVLYLQRVSGGEAVAEAPLVGVPTEPEPGLPVTAQRLTPKPLGTTPWDSGVYQYDGAGNIMDIGTDAYFYDGVQRLKRSSTMGAVENYTYDGFGNMKTRTGQTIPTVLPATNRYQGWAYNEIGAVTSNTTYAFTYDVLGQPLSKTYGAEVENYVYTASDERIGVQRGDWWTWSVRNEGGKVLRQYRSSVSNPSAPALWIEDFVWRDWLLLGSQRPVEMGGRKHFHLDHLGTPRLITSDNGQMVSIHDYYPFGDEKTPVVQETDGGFDREEPLKFTGHERDFAGGFGREDGNYIDYMHARYYTPTTGQFLSPDPVLGDPLHPQSWNRYSYVLNRPITLNDPFGLAPNSRSLSSGDDDCPKNQLCLSQYESDWLEWMLYVAAHKVNKTRDSVRNYMARREASHKAWQKHYDECTHNTASWDVDCSDTQLMTGTVVVGGLGSFGATEGVVVTFSEQAGVAHGARHLVGTGIAEAEARTAITQAAKNAVAGAASAPGAAFWGKVMINGRAILFKAYVMADRSIRIGTFWPF